MITRTRANKPSRSGKANPPTPFIMIAGRRVTLDVVLAVAAILVSFVLHLVALNGLSTDYDEGVYWQSLRAMANGYPLFTSIFSSQPPFFLLAIYPFYLLFGQSFVAANLAIALYSLVGLVATYWAARMLAGRWAGCLAVAVLAVDPLYAQEAITVQAEMPMLAFQALGVALGIAALRRTGRSRMWLLIGSGVAVGLATMVKLFGVSAAVPVALWLAAPLFSALVSRTQPRTGATLAAVLRTILPDLAIFCGAIIATCILVILPFLGSLSQLYDQVIRFHLAAAATSPNGDRFNLRLIASGYERNPLFWAGIIAVGIVIWQVARKHDWRAVPLLLWALADFILLERQQPLLMHHLALLAVPLALLAGTALVELMGQLADTARGWTLHGLPKLYYVLLLVAVATSLVGLVDSAQSDEAATQPPTQDQLQMAIAVDTVTIPGDVVVSDDQYIVGLANRDVPPELVDTSTVRIQSGYLTAAQLESIIQRDDVRVILFASGRFEHLPDFKDWVRANYTAVQTFDHGHTLYVKEPKTPESA